MSLSMERRGGFLVIRPDNRLGLGEAEELSAMLNSIFERGEKYLAIDLCNVQFISSMCIGLLVQAHHEMQRRNGQMVLGNAGPEVDQMLVRSRLDDVFVIADDLETVLKISEDLVNKAQAAASSTSGDSDDIVRG